MALQGEPPGAALGLNRNVSRKAQHRAQTEEPRAGVHGLRLRRVRGRELEEPQAGAPSPVPKPTAPSSPSCLRPPGQLPLAVSAGLRLPLLGTPSTVAHAGGTERGPCFEPGVVNRAGFGKAAPADRGRATACRPVRGSPAGGRASRGSSTWPVMSRSAIWATM